jgi:sugar/nucleoside kinase (ribokinase family)
MTHTNGYDIIGIGAPVVDHIIRVDDAYVQSLEGGKGGMVLINYHTLTAILEKFHGEATLMAGGSGSNTIKGLTHFGNRCALWGKIGPDVTGQIFMESIQELGIFPIMHHSPTPTAHVLCLVTPDGERTMRTYLGASQEMHADDLDASVFDGVKLVHFEGYNLLKGDLPERAMTLAKEAGALVSLDLASYEIVNMHRERVLKMIKNSVDIVIANADEAWALFGQPPEESCSTLKDLCEVGVVLFGEGGCWVGKGDEVIHGAPFPAHPVDTTGAGDLFASGFLHAYLQGWPIDECARLGNRTGSSVVQVLGAEIPPVAWEQIKTSLVS